MCTFAPSGGNFVFASLVWYSRPRIRTQSLYSLIFLFSQIFSFPSTKSYSLIVSFVAKASIHIGLGRSAFGKGAYDHVEAPRRCSLAKIFASFSSSSSLSLISIVSILVASLIASNRRFRSIRSNVTVVCVVLRRSDSARTMLAPISLLVSNLRFLFCSSSRLFPGDPLGVVVAKRFFFFLRRLFFSFVSVFLRCLFLGETMMMALPDKAPLLLLLRVDDRKQFQFQFVFFVRFFKGKKK